MQRIQVDAYKTLPDIGEGLLRPHRYTLTGFNQQINLIVIGYLGRFCSSTHVAYINPYPRQNFCSYCRVWGHQFNLDGCTLDAEQRLETLFYLARRERNVARLSWREGSFHDDVDDVDRPQAKRKRG